MLGALSCAFLAGPWTGRNPVQYKIAGVLIGIGVVLWFVTVLVNRASREETPQQEVAEMRRRGPVN